MINAKDMRSLAQATIEKNRDERRARAEKFVESKIMPAIKEAAANGRFRVTLHLQEHREVAANYLRKNGFSVDVRSMYADISW